MRLQRLTCRAYQGRLLVHQMLCPILHSQSTYEDTEAHRHAGAQAHRHTNTRPCTYVCLQVRAHSLYATECVDIIILLPFFFFPQSPIHLLFSRNAKVCLNADVRVPITFLRHTISFFNFLCFFKKIDISAATVSTPVRDLQAGAVHHQSQT